MDYYTLLDAVGGLHAAKREFALISQLPSLHCNVIGFALDWESHKSLKYGRQCLTELLECACFQPYAIQ